MMGVKVRANRRCVYDDSYCFKVSLSSGYRINTLATMFDKVLIFCCSFLFLAPYLQFAQTAPINLTDLEGEVRLSSPALSPDGRTGVFIASRKNFERNGFDRELMQIDLQTRDQKRLSARKGIGAPAWAPDGETLAFLANGEKGRQLYLLPKEGGEAVAITDMPSGVRSFVWSPDGQSLALVTDQARPEEPKKNKFDNSFEVGNNDFLQTGVPAYRVVYVTDRQGEAAKQVSPPGVTVGTELSLSNISWSANSKKLSFTVYPTPFSGDSDLGQIALLDLESGGMTYLTDHGMRESGARFGPSSRGITYLYPREGVPSNLKEIYRQDPGSGTSKSWTRALDRHIRNYRWTKDGGLLLVATDGLKTSMWHSAQPGEFDKLPMGEVNQIASWDLGHSDAILMVGTGIYTPSELYYKKDRKSAPVQLTHFNTEIAGKQQGKREAFNWASTDDLQPNGVLTYPPDFDPQKQYPLVLYIHGGPTASSTLAFNARAQLMAAKGWVVFQPNYRGSNNLGNAFQRAIANDAAEGPGQDVITGVRALLEKPFIDGKRVAVSGWSYGGWMTAWLIGRYPDVWAAAVAGAAPVDYTDMYSLNDLNRMRRHAITESPYVGDNLEKAYAQSPIRWFSQLRTPTLILSNTGDYRVTVTGSYKLYNALRDNNVPVQFIAYPGPGHFPGDPVRAQTVDVRWLGWLEKYLEKARP